jgi:hypothetical protein
MSSLSGAAAGILGLTGLQGFAFYFVTALVLSVKPTNLSQVADKFIT